MPAPLLISTPGASISIAVFLRMVFIWSAVKERFADLINPAIAPACGAAAEVPKNGFKPPAGNVVETPSAAVTSGLLRTVPPFVENRKLPGVIAVPSALKKTRRGPSELKD